MCLWLLMLSLLLRCILDSVNSLFTGLWSSRNEHERRTYFELYLKRVAEALIQKTIY